MPLSSSVVSSRRESSRERSFRHSLYHSFQVPVAVSSFFLLSIRQTRWCQGSMSSRTVAHLSSFSVVGIGSLGCRMVVQPVVGVLCGPASRIVVGLVGWFGVV